MKTKKFNSYKLYTREEMSKIAKEEGFLFVETSKGDNYEIKKSDVADFIILESDRCNQMVNIKIYVPNPNIDDPFVSTFGCYLNTINQKFREEIIGRLVELQTTDSKPKEVKVFDNDVFLQMPLEELGEEKGKTLQYDRFYKKYYKQQLEEIQELEAEV